MAARNRPRNGLAKEDRDDAHEERSMWEQIIRDLEKCKTINDRAKEVTALILEKEEVVKKCKRSKLLLRPFIACFRRSFFLQSHLSRLCL